MAVSCGSYDSSNLKTMQDVKIGIFAWDVEFLSFHFTEVRTHSSNKLLWEETIIFADFCVGVNIVHPIC